MKKIIWTFDIAVIAFVMLSVCVSVAVAQPLPYSLSGHILNNESECIVGADIILLNERTNDTLILESTTNGEYQQDAYNFVSHYTNGDTIRYNVTYGDVGAVETAKINIANGGTKLDITLSVEGSPETTPNPTPRRSTSTRTSTEMYPDADGDGVSDNAEKIKGSDPNDPCSPNENCAHCIEKRKPQVTPEIFSPVKVASTPMPTPVATAIPIAQTPRAAPAPTQQKEPAFKIPGFSVLLGIMSFVVIFVFKKKEVI